METYRQKENCNQANKFARDRVCDIDGFSACGQTRVLNIHKDKGGLKFPKERLGDTEMSDHAGTQRERRDVLSLQVHRREKRCSGVAEELRGRSGQGAVAS